MIKGCGESGTCDLYKHRQRSFLTLLKKQTCKSFVTNISSLPYACFFSFFLLPNKSKREAPAAAYQQDGGAPPPSSWQQTSIPSLTATSSEQAQEKKKSPAFLATNSSHPMHSFLYRFQTHNNPHDRKITSRWGCGGGRSPVPAIPEHGEVHPCGPNHPSCQRLCLCWKQTGPSRFRNDQEKRAAG